MGRVSDFAAVFSALRKEKKLSQRKAAADLEISQALLSHYENGVREPRLEFVVRACEYYGVSADYILGRTTAKGNFMAIGGGKDNPLGIEDTKKLGDIVNTLAAAFGLISAHAGERGLDEMYRYVSIISYKFIQQFDLLGNSEIKDNVPKEELRILCDAAAKVAEAGIVSEMSKDKKANKKIPANRLKTECPQIYKSVEEMISKVEEEIAKLTAQRG